MKSLRLPITVRVPLIVTLFMVTVSSFASERVLSRLIETQTRQLQDLADNHLDGLALALVESMLREDIWQVFDVLDRSRQRPGDIKPIETFVAGADGFVIASSEPLRIPSQTRVPAQYLQALGLDGEWQSPMARRKPMLGARLLTKNVRWGVSMQVSI